MATKTRKQKRRKQRGGKTVQIKSKNLSSKTHFYNPPVGSTIRNLVFYYFDREVLDPSLYKELQTQTNPNMNVFQNNKRMNLKGKWNSPHSFEKDMETYSILAHMQKRIAERNRKSSEHVLPIIFQILNLFKKTGGKVILYSSAATDSIQKNVCQQFDFYRNPKMPILHIDAAFFTPGHEPYEFYTICNFEMEPTVGTPDFVRRYIKPAGIPLTTRSDRPTEYEKRYVDEVEKQASGRFDLMDQMDIFCVKYYLTEETEKKIRDYAGTYGIPVYIFCQSH